MKRLAVFLLLLGSHAMASSWENEPSEQTAHLCGLLSDWAHSAAVLRDRNNTAKQAYSAIVETRGEGGRTKQHPMHKAIRAMIILAYEMPSLRPAVIQQLQISWCVRQLELGVTVRAKPPNKPTLENALQACQQENNEMKSARCVTGVLRDYETPLSGSFQLIMNP